MNDFLIIWLWDPHAIEQYAYSKGSIFLLNSLFQNSLADLPEMLKRFPGGSPGNLFGEFRSALAISSFDQILTLHGPPAQLSGPLGLQDCMNLHHHIVRFILYHSKIITFSQKDCVFSDFHQNVNKIFLTRLGSPTVPRASRWTYHCGNVFFEKWCDFFFRTG